MYSEIMVTLDKALEVAMELSAEEQDTLIDVLRHRRIEARREEIAQSIAEARRAFQSGELGPQSAEEVVQSLHVSLNEDGA